MATAGFLVVVFNEPDNKLRVTVDSLLDQSLSGQIMVVDDGSERPLWLDAPVHVERLTMNSGISAARNTGLKLIVTEEYVGVVNCDIQVPSTWAEALVTYLEARPPVGAAWTPVMHAERSRRGRWWEDCFEWQGREPAGEVDFAPGHAVMFRRSALDAVDGYDERFRTIAEDHDICARMRDAGFSTHLVPEPPIVSHQDLSLRAMAEKDWARMGLSTMRTRTKVETVVVKMPRRISRHLLRGPRELVLRDVCVAVASVARICSRAAGD